MAEECYYDDPSDFRYIRQEVQLGLLYSLMVELSPDVSLGEAHQHLNQRYKRLYLPRRIGGGMLKEAAQYYLTELEAKFGPETPLTVLAETIQLQKAVN